MQIRYSQHMIPLHEGEYVRVRSCEVHRGGALQLVGGHAKQQEREGAHDKTQQGFSQQREKHVLVCRVCYMQ